MASFVVRNNNTISIARGDTFEFGVTIEDKESESGHYILNHDDALYFGLMDPHQMFENALVKKKYTVDDLDPAGNLTLILTPDDTYDLIPGLYYYSIKLHQVNKEENIDKVITIIPRTKFVIVE